MYVRLRNFIAALGAVGLVLASSSSAGAVASAPVSGGPAGQGTCAAQALAARSHGTVATLRAFGDCEIGRRQKTLAALASVAAGSKSLAASDRAALAAEIDAESSGLAGLKTTIDGQTSVPALRLEIVQIASKYRVYVLLVPQVNLVGAADGVLALQPAFAQMATDLAGRIAAAQAGGSDVAAAQSNLDSMNAEVAAAMTLASPLPGKLLPLTAAEWNSGTAAPVVMAARGALVSARDHLRLAAKFGRAVLVALH